MVNPKPLIESESFSYDIFIKSVIELPVDGFTLGRALAERGYAIKPSSSAEISVAQKQDSIITINMMASIISIQDKGEQISFTVKDVLNMLENECELDLTKYHIIHQFSNITIIKTGVKPKENITKAFFNINMKSQINSIHNSNFMMEGVKFVEGDRYGNKFHYVSIDPRHTRDDTTYYITYTYRNTDVEDVLESLQNTRDRIIQTLKTIENS